MGDPIEICGAKYRFDGMPGPVELRILRRLAPLIGPAVPMVLRRGSKPGVRIEVRPDLDVVKFITATLGAFGSLSDADTDMVQRASLGALSREIDGEWRSVWPAGEDAPIFSDIDGVTILRLTMSSLGCVVKGWLEKSGDAVPPEFQTIAKSLH